MKCLRISDIVLSLSRLIFTGVIYLRYKKLRNIYKVVLIVSVISLGCVSCVSKRNVLYFQDVERLNQGIETNNYQTIIRPDDLLTITVSALNPETVIPFNPPLVSSPTVDGTIRNTQQIQTYLVDKSGYIEFPVVGSIQLGGLTRQEAHRPPTAEPHLGRPPAARDLDRGRARQTREQHRLHNCRATRSHHAPLVTGRRCATAVGRPGIVHHPPPTARTPPVRAAPLSTPG